MAEDVDKIVKTLEDGAEISKDYQKAKDPDSAGGEKVTPIEWVTIGVTNAGKALSFFNNVTEIKEEFIDLESNEAPEIMEAFYKIYSPENPFIKSGVTKSVTGALSIKEGIQNILKAKEWEAENA